LSDASQHVLIEMLPPVLVLHLTRFRYDAAEIKIGKYIQFVPELEVPPGTIFTFLLPCDTRG
jgi:ubiquitin carboxyl-terminal hydrolase 10